MAESEKSLNWVIGAVMVLIAAFGWGFLAGSYSGAQRTGISEMSAGELQSLDTRGLGEARREAKGAFIANAIDQLPNMPAVISWHFSNRIWLPILILMLEVGVVLGGIGAKRLEKQLEQPKSRRR